MGITAYQMQANGTVVADGCAMAWDAVAKQPADMAGLFAQKWMSDGSPAPLPYVVAPVSAPDGPTLSDWRVGLLLWNRLDEVTAKIEALCDKGEPMGFVAKERFEYSNNVFRVQLVALKDALGFSASDVDESLWRADAVAKGDLTGIYIPH